MGEVTYVEHLTDAEGKSRVSARDEPLFVPPEFTFLSERGGSMLLLLPRKDPPAQSGKCVCLTWGHKVGEKQVQPGWCWL